MTNGWLKTIIVTLLTLIIGSYGFTQTSVTFLESKILQRLDRIENSIDRIEDYLIDSLKQK